MHLEYIAHIVEVVCIYTCFLGHTKGYAMQLMSFVFICIESRIVRHIWQYVVFLLVFRYGQTVWRVADAKPLTNRTHLNMLGVMSVCLPVCLSLTVFFSSENNAHNRICGRHQQSGLLLQKEWCHIIFCQNNVVLEAQVTVIWHHCMGQNKKSFLFPLCILCFEDKHG